MTKYLKNIGLVIAGVIVGLFLSATVFSAKLGGVYNTVAQYFPQGLQAGTSNQLVVSSTGALTTSGAIISTGDTTISGGTLNVTTSNTATSTIIGGCFQFYATSTATAHKFQASTTPGTMFSTYGSCPNL